jgi:uncharacterized protein YjbI with pentapeptide repeats
MFNLKKCEHPSCQNPVLCLSEDARENPQSFNSFCFLHMPDAAMASDIVREYLASHDKIVGMDVSFMTFNGNVLSGKRFYGCSFRNCVFNNVNTADIRIRMCMFDFSTYTDCRFIKANIQFASFAGASLTHTHFISSELVHNNFSGITAVNSSFDDTDLYNTRFIRATLTDSAITNCNLQRTVFYEIARQNVSFKLSSTREAFFSESEHVE